MENIELRGGGGGGGGGGEKKGGGGGGGGPHSPPRGGGFLTGGGGGFPPGKPVKYRAALPKPSPRLGKQYNEPNSPRREIKSF
ncbi:unnamed protein product [Pieris brassicae]|uniref:Uncharacterized protein n=1 Tax=Pieris brassicae TaxID=7116 RepID=A0A9P0XG32_PIEBR|nr:unnamed protein product [Pieris brassicae]